MTRSKPWMSFGGLADVIVVDASCLYEVVVD
ncbi:hypothetical protein BJY21_002908 [Kineosphaera limosa]|nr:hypothetical protein [Kineosphaera limosa]